MALRELEVSLPNVSCLSDLGANVVVQISGDMQHEVPKAVSVRVRFCPELFFTEIFGKPVHAKTEVCVLIDESSGYSS